MSVRTRRIAVIVVACVMAFGTLPAVLAGSAPAPSVPALTSTAPDSTASAAGEQFAAQVLASAPIPPGADEWSAPPPAVLSGPSQTIGVSGLIDLDELYLVGESSGPPGSGNPTLSYVLTHLPLGSSVMGGVGGGGPDGSWEGFVVSLPTSGANEYLAQLLYATTETAGGYYVLRIDAQVVWVPDRPGVVSEWACPAVVYVSVGGIRLPPLHDAGCTLLDLVKRDVPAQAAGTKGALAAC
jgi:hypothetical protein